MVNHYAKEGGIAFITLNRSKFMYVLSSGLLGE